MTTTTHLMETDDPIDPQKIRVLILNDSPADAEILVHELRQAEYEPVWERVETESTFLDALIDTPDLILSDYRLQKFDSLRAIALLRERGLDIPVIFVSSTPGEEIAVHAIKQGVEDFLLKDRLSRFGTAVKNALKTRRLRAERTLADEKRRVAEEMFRNLSEHSLVGIQILQDGRYAYANSKLAEIFGYTDEEILALDSWTTVVASDDRNMVLDQVRRRVSGELSRAHYVFRGLRKDQTVIHVEVRSDRIELQGRPAVLGMLLDISERHRAEQTVRASEERFRGAFELTNMPMVLTDLDHRFVRVNEAFARLFGYSQQEMLQLSMGAITHPDELTESHVRREPLLAGEADYFQMEKRYLHRDGHVIWALTNVSLVRDILGHPRQYVGQLQDVTERHMALLELRQAAEDLKTANAIIDQERAQLADRVAERTAELTAVNRQLDRANRAKSDFLAAMSHELRTPLNGILGMNELLLNTELTERQRQFVDACNISGKALLQQINDILDVSRIEAGKLELDVHECNLEALVFDTADMFSHSAQQKGYAMRCHIAPSACVTALCDGNRLRQILVNLIGNAMKFTTSGTVTVRAECVSQLNRQLTVRFSVTDTGVGIPEDRRDRLFAPFSQVDSSTSRKFGGTGLGLSICKQLVELMGGQLGVESQVGVGSTFWFELPLALAAEDATMAQRQHVLAGKRVLAVDGMIDRDRQQIGDSLQAWKCSAEQVATLPEALEAVARAEAAGAPFAAVLADCRLVEGDEYVLLQKLAEHPRLPIIALSTNPDDQTIAYLHQLGVRHVLRDPIRPSVLFNVLVSVLSVAAARQPGDDEPNQAQAERELPLIGHLLVAEDNQINQIFIVELLKYCGCTCDLTADGDEALEAVQQTRYDLILMDCQMPEMDGYTATREIRRREAAGELPGRLPIIALTANALKGDRERCLEAGMDEYLSKPLNAKQMRTMLARFLSPKLEGASRPA